MTKPPFDAQELTVGQLSARSGVAVTALHFYEKQGLIHSQLANDTRFTPPGMPSPDRPIAPSPS